MKEASDRQAEKLYHQLMNLKQYERPDESALIRNRQNIMREVRHVQDNRRQTFGEWLEAGLPWLFADPKYGIAAVFMAFAGLQYLNINAQKAADGNTGIYTSSGDFLAVQQLEGSTVSTNGINYPRLPDNIRLFTDPSGGDGAVKPAAFEVKK